MKRQNQMFIPENSNEEALMLMGRVEALAAYVNVSQFSIDRKMIAAILGFELETVKEEEHELVSL